MEFNLSQILESTILLEGRLEDTKEKYPGNDELIDTLSEKDVSGNNKYLQWMAKQVIKLGYSVPQVVTAVRDFDSSKDRLKKQNFPLDINQYKTVEDFENTFSKLKRREAPSKRELKGLGELVYDGEDLFVVSPRNYEGSCKFGAGAKWCIKYERTDSHWNSYIKNNMFFFAISKNLPSDNPNMKIAIQKSLSDGSNTYWDMPDTSSKTPQNPEITPEVLSVIDNYFIEAKKKIFHRLLEDMVNGVKSTLTFDNIMKVKELANDGQLYKLLSNDITVLNQSSYGSNVNLFKYALERLGDKNMLKLLKSDYDKMVKLLSNDKILSFVDNSTSREEKLELANNLKGHLKTVSPNIRAKIQKWGMTDEDWEKYNTQSSYVFLADDDTGEISGEIYKVDKFEPKSYDIISELKLKLRYKDGISLFGIMTGKDELDEYLGDDVPNDVLSKFKKMKIASS
jgi:hypothetical protein